MYYSRYLSKEQNVLYTIGHFVLFYWGYLIMTEINEKGQSDYGKIIRNVENTKKSELVENKLKKGMEKYKKTPL